MKQLSIIVPVYNVEQYLPKCIDSLVAITNISYEILLIDDGSTDKSGTICDEYSERYADKVTAIHKKNGGVSSARNKGLELAKGNWVYFCDADDWIESHLFSTINLNTDFDLISFGYNKKIKNREYMSSYFKKELLKPNEDYDHIYIFCVWQLIFKKNIIDRNKLNFSTNLKLGEDIEFIIKYISCIDKIYEHKQRIYHYIIRENSAMHSLSTQKRNVYDSLTLLENLYIWFEKKGIRPNWLQLRIDRIAKNIIYSAYQSNISLPELITLSTKFRKLRNLYLEYGYLKNIYFTIASINIQLCYPLLYFKQKIKKLTYFSHKIGVIKN